MYAKINNLSQICFAKQMQFTTGKEKGQNVILVYNGKLLFEVLVDKCLDIATFQHEGVNIGFISANGLDGRKDEFVNVFNGGLLYTCGLDVIGGRRVPFHGRIHNIPARLESLVVNEEGVTIVGEMEQTSLFGDKLVLRRTIKTAINSGTVEVSDVIKNVGYKDAEYCLLYHTNIGYPMLDAGAKLKAPITFTRGYSSFDDEKIENFENMEEPLYEQEILFDHRLAKGEVELTNEKLGKKVKVEYDEKVMPYMAEWKSMVKGDYALGIEPGTAHLGKDFATKTLKPSESANFFLKVSVENL
ncbi:MAG: aldose 1-epimerase family protein [Clostridia bacterium]|nr:aldose 1-epimerase family protein [Clostridia bacterium]